MVKIGILFGGPSREREISFVGGRTVYDNLNKSIFEPVPIFVDSLKNFILLYWKYIYKNNIRDFYPPLESIPDSKHAFQIYVESLGKISDSEINTLISKVGKKIEITELSNYFDLAFLALHGEFGGDGQIQGLLDTLEIPYTGSGVKACAIGIDKVFQKKMMDAARFHSPKVNVISKNQWSSKPHKAFFVDAKNSIGFPMVVRPANQGSSIGVSILDDQTELEDFQQMIDAAFFIHTLHLKEWSIKTDEEKEAFIRNITDIHVGIGFPVKLNKKIIYHPNTLWKQLDKLAKNNVDKTIKLESLFSESKVIIESFVHGKEFSCIVVKLENGNAVALPPTEIVKGEEVFDYRAKYFSGLSQKITPINLPLDQINQIRSECVRLFEYLDFNTYARIDGFMTINRTVVINDPNTSSGILPSSFFFHQAAEMGLNPSQFLSFIIRMSLQERIRSSILVRPKYQKLLKEIDRELKTLKGSSFQKKKVGIILGGYSGRHASVESGRNIYEKLASSDKYEPVPIFLSGDATNHILYQLPINLLLKENADDIREKLKHFDRHPVLESIQKECKSITEKYATENVVFQPEQIGYDDLLGLVDQVFIAIHGRPGEDGQIQKRLEYLQIPYNGSNERSSQITINKYKTLQILKDYGFTVTNQLLIEKHDYIQFPKETLKKIEKQFSYPFIAKPVDGCSMAVKVIKTQNNLCSFLKAMFREEEKLSAKLAKQLNLENKEVFPQKEFVLIEALITDNGAKRFLETTTGLLTHIKNRELVFEILEPSEITSGKNITPARFSDNEDEYQIIAKHVKSQLKKAAQLLGVQGFARIDAFVRVFEVNKVETIIIEVNSLPGMTAETCIFEQAAINHYKPYEFIDKILEFGVNIMEYS